VLTIAVSVRHGHRARGRAIAGWTAGPARQRGHAPYRHDFDGPPALDWDDSEPDWQSLPDEVLDFFGSGTTPFVFGNDESFRYYMPAFMLRSLGLGHSVTAVRALDVQRPAGTLVAEVPVVRMLDAAQRSAIVGFLEHVVLYEAPAPWAERALSRVWRPASHAATASDPPT